MMSDFSVPRITEQSTDSSDYSCSDSVCGRFSNDYFGCTSSHWLYQNRSKKKNDNELIIESIIPFDFDQHADRSWPLILVGSLVFLPGFYHVRIAYWAWQGDKNFSYEDIPDLD